MNITFGKHISRLLKQHECVVLPSIGALVLKQKAAHISGGQIFPASKTIHFNKNITSADNLITSSLINFDGLSFSSARLELDKFISDIKFDLSQKGFFDIDDLGRLKQSNGTISFVSNAQISSLDINNYGFNNLSIIKISREIISDNKEVLKIERNETVSQTKEVITEINKNRKIRKTSLVGLAATFLLMITIGSLMFTNTSFDNLKVQNANVLNFLVPTSTHIDSKVGRLKRMENHSNTFDSKVVNNNKTQQETATLKGEKEKVEESSELKTFKENLKSENTLAKVSE